MKKLFTKDFVIKSAELRERSDKAEAVVRKMFHLSISTSKTDKQCEKIIKEYIDIRDEAVTFILNQMPEELFKEMKEFKVIGGCFVTEHDKRYTMNLNLNIHIPEYGNLNFKFDPETNTVYNDNWATNDKNTVDFLNKYFKETPKEFNSWIVYNERK